MKKFLSVLLKIVGIVIGLIAVICLVYWLVAPDKFESEFDRGYSDAQNGEYNPHATETMVWEAPALELEV